MVKARLTTVRHVFDKLVDRAGVSPAASVRPTPCGEDWRRRCSSRLRLSETAQQLGRSYRRRGSLMSLRDGLCGGRAGGLFATPSGMHRRRRSCPNHVRGGRVAEQMVFHCRLERGAIRRRQGNMAPPFSSHTLDAALQLFTVAYSGGRNFPQVRSREKPSSAQRLLDRRAEAMQIVLYIYDRAGPGSIRSLRLYQSATSIRMYFNNQIAPTILCTAHLYGQLECTFDATTWFFFFAERGAEGSHQR